MTGQAARAVWAAVAGAMFGAGLLLAGMTRPEKVIGFLDVGGAWDPALMFVMVGAIGVHLVAYRLIRRRSSPLLDGRFHVPTRRDLDGRLLAGAAIFGVGWGLAGFCPGPALVAAVSAESALIFVAAMAIGMVIQRVTAGGERS
ncbi:MAG TPA: DUF6691 family protein [Kofleriaceae bacterium]|nr:DUF6691 family protein [Kofleriaceae bacterium]